MPLEPFTIHVRDEDLADLRARLARTRPLLDPVAGWDLGIDPALLGDLLEHWRRGFDWRAVEQRVNAWPQVLAEVDGRRVHAVRAGTAGAPVVVLLHGWPGSFLQMLPLAALLAPDFDVVIPSLPGFGFSDAPPVGSAERQLAGTVDRLLTGPLGVRRYAVHGSDFGAGIASWLAAEHAEHVTAVHLSGTSPRAADPMPDDASPAELRFAADVAAWREREVGYSAIQSTKPQTLAVALGDSPAGTLAWIVEKYRRWSDCGGDVLRRFTRDELVEVAALYWLTGTIGTSMRLYAAPGGDPDLRGSAVPIGHLLSDRDMLHTPREWVARSSRIDRFTQVDRGGHFLEQEEPDLVAADLRAFLADIGVTAA